ncbi:MAG TPA: lytic transglycosylase domain-containing protein [Chthonomonadaceae bacterium]|nr:lytic transglycosylase domain-containing protein [Chthonomonadaceae bacterium]
MGTHFQAALGRIQEIEARLGLVARPNALPVTPPGAPASAANRANPVTSPFPVMLAQANGLARLQPLGGGPFSPQIEALITKYANQNGLQPELVRAVIQQESSGDTHSVSAVGAQGLMQLMPETAQAYGVTDAFDPEQNISAGTRYLSALMHEFNNDLPKALAAYNAGANRVRQYGGVPPFHETQQYVQRIMGMLGQH